MAKKRKDEDKFEGTMSDDFKEVPKEEVSPLVQASKPAPDPKPTVEPASKQAKKKRAEALLNFSGWFAHTGRPIRHKPGMEVWLKKRGGNARRQTRAAWDALFEAY